MRREIWAEFMPYDWVRADIPRLAAAGVQLNLAIPLERLADPALKRLLQVAEALQVPVGAWLLLPDAQGYWPNAENARLFEQALAQFLRWLAQEHLRVAEIIVDMETPLALSRLLKGRLWQGLQLEYQRWLDPLQQRRFDEAVAIYTAAVARAHAAGLQMQVVSYPFVVHDALARTTVLQRFLQIPVTPVPWDRVSLMIYRSSFQDFCPLPLSAGLVTAYLQLARRAFSQPVNAALGVLGTVGKLQEGGFGDPARLAPDVAAARAAGADGIQLFSLDGLHQLAQPENGLRLYQTAARVHLPTAADQTLLQSLQLAHRSLYQLDRLLSLPSRRYGSRSRTQRPASPLHAPAPTV